MNKESKKPRKKELIQWAVMLAVIAVLWVTGWHRPLIAGVQRLILSTGLMQPDVSEGEVVEISGGVNLDLVDEQGNYLNLRELKGKVVFLNIWATWCPPCRAEMPGIQTLFEEVKEENVAFVMISRDDDFEKAKQYKDGNGFTFPIYHVAGPLPPALSGSSIPRTYVLDTLGNVLMEHDGMAKYNTRKFTTFLRKLM